MTPSPILRAAIALALLPLPALAQTPPAEDDAVRLDRINVFGSAAEVARTAGSAHYLGPDQLEAFNYRDVHRVLRQVPGVYLVEEEGFGLRPNIGIRGSGTDRNARITVMEDGVLIAPAPYAAPSAYYFPTMSRMHAVEIRKGSASVQAGPRTTGGAVNLLSTPIPQARAGEVDVAIGSDATLLAHGWTGTMGERFGGLVEFVRQQTDGFKALDGGGDTGYRLNDVMAKLRFTPGPDAARYQQWDLKLGRTTQVGDESYLGLTDADFAANPWRRYAASALDRIDTEHTTVELRHLVELSPNADLTTVAYRNDFSRNWYKLNDVQGIGIGSILADPATYALQYGWLTGLDSPDNALRLRNNNRAYYAQGLQTVLGLRLGDEAVSHDIELGLRLHRDQEDRFQDDDRYRMQGGRLVLTSDGLPGSQDNRVGDARALSLYLQDEISVGRWILTPGLRYERIELTRTDYAKVPGGRSLPPTSVRESEVSQLIPGFGATWLLSDAVTAFASVHKGFNPPGPGSNSDPEESVNAEIGLRLSRGAAHAELVGFVSDYSNLVGTCTASSGGNCTIGDQFDGGEARVSGLEASAGHRIALRDGLAMPLSLAYTWTRAEFRNSFSSGFEEWGDVQSGDRLPYLPAHQLHAEAGLEGDGWRLDLGVSLIDRMRSVAGRGPIPADEATDRSVVWDLAGQVDLAHGFEAYGRIENLTDRAYVVSRRPAGARPGQPRTFMAGLRYRF